MILLGQMSILIYEGAPTNFAEDLVFWLSIPACITEKCLAFSSMYGGHSIDAEHAIAVVEGFVLFTFIFKNKIFFFTYRFLFILPLSFLFLIISDRVCLAFYD